GLVLRYLSSRPTARKAEFSTGNKMAQEAKAVSRKARGIHNPADTLTWAWWTTRRPPEGKQAVGKVRYTLRGCKRTHDHPAGESTPEPVRWWPTGEGRHGKKGRYWSV